MKVKAANARQFDKDGFKLRAGCLCFKDKSKKEVLLVSSSAQPEKWVVPAGCVEFNEANEAAAVRETREEAYVSGYVEDFIGIFQNDSSKSRTAVYSLIVTEEHTPRESIHNELKSRQWFTLNDAVQALCHKPVQQSYFVRLCSPKAAVVSHLGTTITLSSQRSQTTATSATQKRTLVRIVQ